MCGTPFANVLHAFAKRAARSGEQAERGHKEDQGEEEGRYGEKMVASWGEDEESSVFLVDPPRRALEENSGLRRRGLFVPRRDAFGASYLRVTPCNRAPASVFSFLLSVSLSLFLFLCPCPSLYLSFRRRVITLFVDLSTARGESQGLRPCTLRAHLNSKKRYDRHDETGSGLVYSREEIERLIFSARREYIGGWSIDAEDVSRRRSKRNHFHNNKLIKIKIKQ